jgi:hypothetical protein
LLFFDHITTLTPASLQIIASRSGLQVATHCFAPPSIGDFQLVVLGRAGGSANPLPCTPQADLHNKRCRYLHAWRTLETNLVERTFDRRHLRMFGAAQTAALLRAYAPTIWDRVELLTLDPPIEPWPLDRPVIAYERLQPDLQRPLIVATPPGTQAGLAVRLRRDAHLPVIWEDLIEVKD